MLQAARRAPLHDGRAGCGIPDGFVHGAGDRGAITMPAVPARRGSIHRADSSSRGSDDISFDSMESDSGSRFEPDPDPPGIRPGANGSRASEHLPSLTIL